MNPKTELICKAFEIVNKETIPDKWIVGYYTGTGLPMFNCAEDETHYMRELGGSTKIINPYTVCRYTGVKDCRGERVFENDLIRSIMGEESSPMIVDWNKDLSQYTLYTSDYIPIAALTEGLMDRFEVVGNRLEKCTEIE